MNTLPEINQVNISSENISKIFENQKKILKQDILYFKEDMLKDFRQIENKLNKKYDNQNTDVVKHIENFENMIKGMNNKISQLSNLISTDKNIQEKVTQLFEFKTKMEDNFLSQNLSIKNISKELRSTINNYDNLISNSIIYPGTIGPNCKFSTFHDLIDYILLNIAQLSNFKDKTDLDYKSYKTKLEQLVKSFKMQAESIITNNTEFTNKKITDSEKKFQGLLENQDSKIFDLKMENVKLNSLIENKIDKLNNERKKMLDIKSELYEKFEKEVYMIKNFSKSLINKFESFQNDFKMIKNKFKTLNNFINELRMNMSGDFKLEAQESEDIFQKPKGISQLVGNGTSVKSIIKKYIMGEMDIKDINNPIKRQKSIANIDNEIQFKKNLFFANRPHNNSFHHLSKRMTFGPDKMRSIQKLEKSFVNNHIENPDKNVSKFNNNISEETNDNIDYLSIYKSKNLGYKNSSRKESYNKLISEHIKENENENDFSSLYEEVDNKEISDKKQMKNKDIPFINKSIKKSNKKVSFDENNIQSNKQNNILKDDNLENDHKKISDKNINLKDENIIINDIKHEDNNIIKKEIKDNLKTISYEKLDINSKIFPKISSGINSERVPYKNILKTQEQEISEGNKLSKIKGRCLSHYKNLNQSNIENKYYNLKKIGLLKKLNIVEMNFDEVNPFLKPKEEIKKSNDNIKNNGANIVPERNKIIEKNKIYKALKISNSDANMEKNSLGKIVINNMGNNYYYNMMFKDDSQSYNNQDYLNLIQKNKIDLNNKKINLKKHK